MHTPLLIGIFLFYCLISVISSLKSVKGNQRDEEMLKELIRIRIVLEKEEEEEEEEEATTYDVDGFRFQKGMKEEEQK